MMKILGPLQLVFSTRLKIRLTLGHRRMLELASTEQVTYLWRFQFLLIQTR